MKIALINLAYDNNYGGNLQRYALVKVLQNLGHDVIHINLRFVLPVNFLKLFPHIVFRILKKILGRKIDIFPEWRAYRSYHSVIESTEKFYNKYIPHTCPVLCLSDYKRYDKFDVVVVGSDQVWRKKIAMHYLDNFFLKFLPVAPNQKRITYGVSLGSNENELDEKEISELGVLYKRFNAVSVREPGALELFKNYNWTNPAAQVVLDPTLLLSASDYKKILKKSGIHNNIFCYILDLNSEKQTFVQSVSKRLNIDYKLTGINSFNSLSIEQWLGCFYDSEFIITDSFHGMIFSIIFHKNFIVIGNKFRGMGRITDFLSSLQLENHLITEEALSSDFKIDDIQWDLVDEIIEKRKLFSINFLKNNISI